MPAYTTAKGTCGKTNIKTSFFFEMLTTKTYANFSFLVNNVACGVSWQEQNMAFLVYKNLKTYSESCFPDNNYAINFVNIFDVW